MRTSRYIRRLYDKTRLRIRESRVVSHRNDWEGYHKVLREFKTHDIPKIYVNQIWTEWRDFMEYLAHERQPKRILEIGTGRGGSLYFFSKLCGEKSLLISIDTTPTAIEYISLLTRRKLQHIYPILADSHDLKTVGAIEKILGDAPLDLLYIDGDHSYEGVKRDFELYRRFCNDNSIVCFHDINPDYRTSKGIQTDRDSGEVYKFWNEVKLRYEHREFIESKGQDGFGLGMIFYKKDVLS